MMCRPNFLVKSIMITLLQAFPVRSRYYILGQGSEHLSFPNGAEQSSHLSLFRRPSHMGSGSRLLAHLLRLVKPTLHGGPLVILIMIECIHNLSLKASLLLFTTSFSRLEN